VYVYVITANVITHASTINIFSIARKIVIEKTTMNSVCKYHG